MKGTMHTRVTQFLLGLLIVYVNHAFTYATDDNNFDAVGSGVSVDSSERIVLVSLFLFLAVSLSAVSCIMAYCVYTEYQIIQNFVSNGVKLYAKVIDYILTNRIRCEYIATIEYRFCHDINSMNLNNKERDEESTTENNLDIRDCFATIMRKQIKCVESDFVQGNTANKGVTTRMPQHDNSQSICIEIRKDLCSEDDQGSCDDVNENFPSFEYAIFNPPQQFFIAVVVLPEHPTSAIGYVQLLQSLDHFPIIVLITSLSLLAYFFVYLAIINFSPGNGPSINLIKALVVLAISVLMEIMVLFLCCNKMIQEMMNVEYKLHDGDDADDDKYFNFKTEDETLYTIPSSFGGPGIGIGLTSSASISWKHSSPVISSKKMKHQQLSAPSTPNHQMDDFILD